MVAIRAALAVRYYVPVLLLFTSFAPDRDGVAGKVLTGLFVLYTIAKLHGVVVEWWSTRYAVDDAGLRSVTGLLVREELSFAWRDVVSFEVSQPLLHRLARCSLVRVQTAAVTRSGLTLDTVSAAEAARLRQLFELHRPVDPHLVATPVEEVTVSAGPAAPSVPEPLADDVVVYAARPVDHLLISITYGQFLVAVPLVLDAWSRAADYLPLPELGLDLMGFIRSASWPTAVAAVLATCLAAVGYGFAAAWLRYGGFRVLRREDGSLGTISGLLAKEERQVVQASALGLKLQQNPLMRVLGHARLSVVSSSRRDQQMANTVFPVARLPHLLRSVEQFFPQHTPLLTARWPQRRGLAAALTAAGLLGPVLAWAVARMTAPELSSVVLALAVLTALVSTNQLWTHVVADHERRLLVHRRGFAWVTTHEFPVSAVHTAELRQGVSGRLLSTATLSLTVHDGRCVRLRVHALRVDVVHALLGGSLASLSTRGLLVGAGDRSGPGRTPSAVDHGHVPRPREQAPGTDRTPFVRPEMSALSPAGTHSDPVPQEFTR